MHLISWNPSNRSQFAHLSPALQLEIFDIIEENDARTLSLTDIIPSDHVNCFEWQYSNQNSLLAYGTTTGAVTVVNRALSTQTLLPSSTLKRPCHQIAWNYGQTNKLSAGFESIKSNDSCILIFDLESQKSLKLPSNESCCSLNWLPQHDCLIFSGNSMGWIKLFDLRCAAPVLSWHSHPANRPRKVKGISPCLLDGNIVASYSDAVGDTVKIWDLRLIEGKAVKKGSLPRGFSVNPYHYSHDEYNNNIVTSACINDISWSPSRTDLLAVATSNSRSILFFKYDNGKMETQNLETKFPVSVVHTVEPVKSLSWHLADSDNLQISRPSIIESINRTLEKQLEITSVPVKWDDFLLESVHYTSSLIREPQNQQIQTPHKPEAPVNKKLLALTSISFVETDVREAAPFTFSEQRLVVQSQKGVKIFDLFPSKEEAKLLNTNTTFEDVESYLADITSVMKDRAMSGYSFDAPANLDIFSEEIDSLNNKIANLYKHGANVDRKQLNIERTFQRVHEVHRVWVWIDRVETSTRFTKLSLQNCGVLPAFSVQTVSSEVNVDTSTGAQIFSSEIRSQIRKVSGWLNINEHSQDAEQESLGGSDLLDHFIDDCESICFERAAMLALWHGNLDLAVDVLHGATSSPDTGLNSDDDYSQIIALVASCIAGYHVQHPNQAQNRWSHGNETRVRASWKTTCNLAIRKLKTFEQFTVSYLLAGCQFLLANAEKSSPESFLDYEFLLKDEHIYLEDKIAFAATYLNDQQLQRWMTSSYNDSLKNGNLEGLMFTGLNKDGLALLQGYLDSTSDIQSVALITSRILCGGGLSSTPIPPNHQSKIVDSDLQMTEKVTKWINSYRQLLTRWELYNERAHLDIEISQKIQKTHEYRQKFAVAAPTNAGRARGGRVEKISLPVYEGVSQHLNFHYIKIKCSFCGQSLPADDIATNRMETLRTQNNLINCCSNCNKQLPRCYVCKLYVGVSNPYLKVKQAALMRSSNTNPDASSNKSNAVSSTTTPNAKGKHPSGAQNSLHQNTKSIDCAFDQWLLFCQRCRHGGHTVCLSKWFAAGTDISSLAKETRDVSIQRIAGKGQVCGVNGCDCECKIIL